MKEGYLSMESVRYALAVLCRHPEHPERILLVQRPEDDPELPGIWGLPAVSLRDGEDDHAALERLATTKLGTTLLAPHLCGEGEQRRPHYRLRMRLYEAVLQPPTPKLPPRSGYSEVTLYRAWRWGRLEDLRPSAAAGSLCSQLALRFCDGGIT